jgi:hypothetical protein
MYGCGTFYVHMCIARSGWVLGSPGFGAPWVHCRPLYMAFHRPDIWNPDMVDSISVRRSIPRFQWEYTNNPASATSSL